MFGSKELDSLQEFKKAWDEDHEAKAEAKQPKDTGAVTDMDDFDYGDPAKDTAKATEIAESNAPSVPEPVVKTTPEDVNTVDTPVMTFKERFAKARKAGEKVFDWDGKKIAVKLKSEVAKPAVSVVVQKESTPQEVSVTKTVSTEPSTNSGKTVSAVSSSLLGNLIPPSWSFGGAGSGGKKEVADVASPKRTNSPMRTAPESQSVVASPKSPAAKPVAKDDVRIAANGETVDSQNKAIATAASQKFMGRGS